jgi:uncharacterized membrane protein YcaP (DUF421 family)
MKSLWAASYPLWVFVFRGMVVYITVLMLLRLGGKRQVGQMGTGEFVAILLISNAVQNAMNGGDNSITGGIILAATIVFLSVAIDYLTYKSQTIENIVEGRPTLLVHGGRLLEHNLRKERLSAYELQVMLRHQGIQDISEVADAVLESDGKLSVTKKSEGQQNHGDG